MRKTVIGAILFVGLSAFLAPPPAKAAWSVSITYFRQELAPYGEWVVTTRYGYCWRPTVVRAGWRPYWDGKWIYTDYGWTWVSYDPFGDDCFHYGTWVWADDYGWCWEPGYVWAPAWVTWSYTDTYIGWAPVPATFEIGVTGYVGSPVVVSQSSYVFVPAASFIATNVSTVGVSVTENATILASAHNVTSFSVSGGVVHTAGLAVPFVERASGKAVHKSSLSISGHNVKPAALAAAGIAAGRKARVTASATERAAVATKAKAPQEKEAKAPQVKRAGASTGKPAKAIEAKEAKSVKIAKGGTPPASKAGPSPKREDKVERKESKRVVAEKPVKEVAPKPEPKIVEKKRANPATKVERKEETRVAKSARGESPKPMRAEAPQTRVEKAPQVEGPQPQLKAQGPKEQGPKEQGPKEQGPKEKGPKEKAPKEKEK